MTQGVYFYSVYIDDDLLSSYIFRNSNRALPNRVSNRAHRERFGGALNRGCPTWVPARFW